MEKISNKFISLNVHDLVDFILRKGDIDNRFFNNSTMLEGTFLHTKIQTKLIKTFESEVFIDGEINFKGFTFYLCGRIDLLKRNNKIPVIGEIKTTNADLETFSAENFEWHIGQAKCYAFLYLQKFNLKSCRIKMFYVSQNKKEEKEVVAYFTYNQLKKDVEEYLDSYLNFYKKILEIESKENESCLNLKFPYKNARDGQTQMIELCKKTIDKNEISFIQAPTGIGKTIASLYGALYQKPRSNINKIFYLGPKNSTFESAIKAIDSLNNQGANISSVEILSKEKMCLKKGCRCNVEECEFCKDYYTNLRNNLFDILTNDNKNFSSNTIKEFAIKNKICPFEFSLDLSLFVSLIICDYNYVFHPISYLKRFFDAKNKRKYTVLIDEAHNLPSRARDMYSCEFSELLLRRAKNIKEIPSKKLKNSLKDIFNVYGSLKDKYFKDTFEINYKNIATTLIPSIQTFINANKEFASKNQSFKNKILDDFSLMCYRFLNIFELVDTNFKIYFAKNEVDVFIKIYCFNPSSLLIDTVNKNIDSAILFSGTLKPIEYFRNVLFSNSFNSKINFLELKSPYNENNLKIMYNDAISLFYKDRLKTFDKVIYFIKTFVSQKVGNYLVFVPSFEYLEQIKENILINDDTEIVYQFKNMTSEDSDAFLNKFKSNNKHTLVGIAVLGGIFNESIDLIGDKLIGTVIVGVALSQINKENNYIKDYFDQQKKGFEYAYVNPGINRIMQAIGRVIRDENDVGAVLLIDKRYSSKTYLDVIKSYGNNYSKVNTLKDVRNVLKTFYNN